jgi:hypothetical protein
MSSALDVEAEDAAQALKMAREALAAAPRSLSE